MILYYDSVVIKKHTLFSEGKLNLPNEGLVLITGKNGCGKTMLLQNIFSNPKNNMPMILVNQTNDAIISGLSIVENISMTLDKKINKEISRQIEELGFGYLLTHSSWELSGGEKRIVSFLRGYFAPENVILVDEPTNDLSREKVEQELLLLQEMKKKKLLLVISHDSRLVHQADHTITIKDNKVYNDSQNDDLEKAISIFRKDNKIISKSFHPNILSFLFAIIIFILSTVQIFDFKNNEPKKDFFVSRNNQVELYKPVSFLQNLEYCLSFDVSTIVFETDPISMIKNSSYLIGNYFGKKLVSTEYNFGFISSCDDYTVYPMEYFDSVNRQGYYVCDYYLEKYFGSPSHTFLDTSSLFDWPSHSFDDSLNSVKIEEDKYFNVIEELNETVIENTKLKITAVAIVFKHKADLTVLKKNLAAINLNDGTTIRGNQICEYVYNVKLVSLIFNGVIKILIALLLWVCFDLFFFFLIMRNKKSELFVFKYYGFDEQEFYCLLSRKINPRIFKVILCFSLFLVNYFVFISSSFALFEYLYSLAFFFALPLIYWIDNVFIRKLIRYYFNWKRR